MAFFSIRSSTSFGSIPLLAKTSSRGLAAPKGFDLPDDACPGVDAAAWERGLSCNRRAHLECENMRVKGDIQGQLLQTKEVGRYELHSPPVSCDVGGLEAHEAHPSTAHPYSDHSCQSRLPNACSLQTVFLSSLVWSLFSPHSSTLCAEHLCSMMASNSRLVDSVPALATVVGRTQGV